MEGITELPSGLIVSDWVAEDYIKRHKHPIGIDLFAGAGGFSLGMIQAGFEIVAGVDNSPECALTYMCNLGTYPCQFYFVESTDEKRLEKMLQKQMKLDSKSSEVTIPLTAGSGWLSHEPEGTPGVGNFFLGDIRKLSGRDILEPLGLKPGDVDVVVGGPPCQGFTTAGKRDVMDPRSSLVFEFARLVCEIRPKSMVLENVPGMINMLTPQGVPVVDALCRVLEDGGFGAHKSFLRCIESQTGAVGLLKSKRGDVERAKKLKAKVKPKEPSLFEANKGTGGGGGVGG